MVLGYGLRFFTALDLDALCAFPGGRLHPIKQGNRKENRDYSVSGFLQGRPQRGHEQPDPETEADKPEQRFGDWQRGTDRASTGLR